MPWIFISLSKNLKPFQATQWFCLFHIVLTQMLGESQPETLLEHNIPFSQELSCKDMLLSETP